MAGESTGVISFTFFVWWAIWLNYSESVNILRNSFIFTVYVLYFKLWLWERKLIFSELVVLICLRAVRSIYKMQLSTGLQHTAVLLISRIVNLLFMILPAVICSFTNSDWWPGVVKGRGLNIVGWFKIVQCMLGLTKETLSVMEYY